MYRSDETGERPVVVVAMGRKVFGLDARTGSRCWEHRLDGVGPIELVVAESVVLACTTKSLACIEYPGGQLVGRVALEGNWTTRPSLVLQDARIYVGMGGEVTCYALDGRRLWREPFQGEGVHRVALGFPGNVRQIDERGQ